MPKALESKFQSDKVKLSPYNYDERVIGNLNIPKKISLCDATLREGEQGSIVGFSTEEKKEYLRKAAETGVELVQLISDDLEEDKALLKVIHDEGFPMTTEILAIRPTERDAWKGYYDMLIDMGIDRIEILSMFTPYSAPMVRNAPWDYVIADCAQQIEYIASKGGFASFDPMDGPRTDLDLLMKAYTAAVQAGAKQLRVLDSVGTASPATWRFLVSTVRKAFPDVKIAVHCHNDFGQAMANVCASLEVGVDVIDVCSNGLGERAGNASLAEVAATAELLYGIETGIRLDKLRALSVFTADIAKRSVSKNAPIVGDWAFAHGAEGHYVCNAMAPWVFENMRAEVFGNSQPVLLGAEAGIYTTKAKLASLGYKDVPDETVANIVAEIKRESSIRKSVLSDETIRYIVEKSI